MPTIEKNTTANCPLCNSKSSIFYQKDERLFFQCANCYGIFLDKRLRLSSAEEKARYNTHNNDVDDERYQQFVSPITSAVIKDFTKNHIGLDFGAGTGPVISKLLTDIDFQISQYDPFYHNYPMLLKSKYDYIVCCEVIEHFYNPNKEFKLLKNILKKHGKLYCMTVLFDDSMNFHNWYYKKDPTHVFFYQPKTIGWIKEHFNFSNVIIKGRLIIFSN